MTFDEWFHKEYEPADLQIKQYAENKEGLHIPATVYLEDLKKAFEAGQKGKVVEHFESYGQCRDSRRIAELEAENERLTVSYETLKLHDEEEIGMLKSENAELKDDNKVMADNYSEMEQKFYNNLTKAKVALRNVIDYLGQFCSDYPDCVIEAEQFLKESE